MISPLTIRHRFVYSVWKILNGIENMAARRAVLPEDIFIESNLAYIDDGLREHQLDVYVPHQTSASMPVIVYFHGGGFIVGDKVHTRQYCLTLAAAGFCVVNANYRLAPRHIFPAQLRDVMAVLAWVRDNCARYQGSGERIILAGDSAGAYLAAMAAALMTNRSLAAEHALESPISPRQLRAVLLFSGLFDLESGAGRRFVSIQSVIELSLGVQDIRQGRALGRYSVLKNITGQFPPAFVSSGEVDGLHPESVELVRVLDGYNIHSQAFFFDNTVRQAFHCYQKQLRLPAAVQCLEAVAEFLGELDLS